MKLSLTTLETAIIDKLLEGDDEVLYLLRAQFEVAAVNSRELTGSGFFLTFFVPEQCTKLTDYIPNIKPDFYFGDVDVEIENLKSGASALLWIRSGKLHMLEAYSYEGKWPETIGRFKLSYFSGSRDITELREQWLQSHFKDG